MLKNKLNILSLPNILSLSRIVLSPFLVIGLLNGDNFFWSRLLLTLTFTLIALTDLLDGYLARKTNEISRFGRCIDPISDKILVLFSLFTLSYMHKASFVATLIITFREICVSGLREFVSKEYNLTIFVSSGAKFKTGLQMVSIGMIIFFSKESFWLSFSNFLLIISALVSMLTLFIYGIQVLKFAGEKRFS